MHIDPTAILALISDLTSRLAASEAEVDRLRAEVPANQRGTTD